LPAQSVMCVPAAQCTQGAEVAVAVLADRAALVHRAGGGGLLAGFAAIADPRRKRGVRHSLPTILGLCTAAVLSGCQTLG
jgi:DDE_Tnp_1-associated